MITVGEILVCDICGARKVYDKTKSLPKRCWNRDCRKSGWNSGGEDRRTWPRVKPEKMQGKPPKKG
jgi:hypothetical protein